ncbi:hypothetical protein FA95DRAFT_781347 [Auriscalpium vulgare]|uniref:Uncharacterized protein n=1 Tax=Auriscalpium vulgare TaxID=40419 RepID=A0ACB8RAU4_9AGAM|nr:hypothetical protein FA95DRAFT_781347 [Auriscalpium vulgare]
MPRHAVSPLTARRTAGMLALPSSQERCPIVADVSVPRPGPLCADIGPCTISHWTAFLRFVPKMTSECAYGPNLDKRTPPMMRPSSDLNESLPPPPISTRCSVHLPSGPTSSIRDRGKRMLGPSRTSPRVDKPVSPVYMV